MNTARQALTFTYSHSHANGFLFPFPFPSRAYALSLFLLSRCLGAWAYAALNLEEIVSHYDEHLRQSRASAHKFAPPFSACYLN